MQDLVHSIPSPMPHRGDRKSYTSIHKQRARLKARPSKLFYAACALSCVLTVTLVGFIKGAAVAAHSREGGGLSSINSSSASSAPNENTQARARQLMDGMPLYFEANRGQAPDGVKFISRSGHHMLALSPTEVALALRGEGGEASATLRMSMVGANPKPELTAENQLPGHVNYMRGKSRADWKTDVPTYGRVLYHNLYPGIDALFYGDQHKLEYDFKVAPGSDPSQINLRFSGADDVRLDANGDLVFTTAAGEVRQLKPYTYQEIEGQRQEIASRFRVVQDGSIGFDLGRYDASKPLVIDPVLSYSTYLGSSGTDSLTAVAVDGSGNAYVTGSMFGAFPTTPGAFDTTNGGQDLFISKLSPTGALVYSTYISGTGGNNEAKGIAVDAQGNVYITGKVVANVIFPTTGAYDTTINGSWDAFVCKLNATGSAMLYSTYLGTASEELGNGIAVDPSGDIYVVGYTKANNFPVVNAFQATYAGGSQFGNGDAFLARIHPGGGGASDLVYSTYLGGAADERAFGVAADGSGNAYLVGSTNSNGFPTTMNAFDTGNNNNSLDAFVAEVNTNASGSASLVYSSFFGGDGSDEALAVTIDNAAQPNVYLTGYTTSTATTFPVTAGAYQTANASGSSSEAFLARINPAIAGTAGLTYSTYIGGNNTDQGYGVARDAAGHVYVSGTSNSTNFPVTPDAVQSANQAGSYDAFIFELNPAGTGTNDRIFSTLFGGSGNENNPVVAVDSNGNIIIAGTTNSSNLSTQNAVQANLPGGISDGFIARISSAAGTFNISGRITNLSNAGAAFAGITVQLSGSSTGVRYTDAQGNYSFAGLAAGDYTVTPVRANYTFNVPSQSFAGLNANQTADFAATVNSYTISGKVTQQGGPQNGQPLAGADVTLRLNNSGGAVLQTVTTNANGDYSFDPQVAERTYFVSVAMPAGATQSYTFATASGSNNSISSLSGNVSVNFLATPLYTISGRVADAQGNGISGVSVSTSLTTVTTNANGDYSFSGARPNTSYTITPSKTGFNFTPVNRTVSNLLANATGVDFVGAGQTVTISGHITNTTSQPAGQPLAGVTVKLTGGTTTQTTTNQNGDYSFTVGVNANYTVTPELTDYTFTPSNKTVFSVTTNQTADFTAAQLFDIRVTVKDTSDQPINGASVNVSGLGLSTNAQGIVDVTNRPGGQSYTVSVSKAGYTFGPQQTFTLIGDKLDVVFTGTPQTYKIGGKVTQQDGTTPISGMTVKLNDSVGQFITSTTTAGDGTYNFPNLNYGATFRVNVPTQAGYLFSPSELVFNSLSADQTAANFKGTATNYTISGRTVNAGANPISGVTLTLVGTSSSMTNATATSDAQGNYSFGVPAGGNYTITPAKQDYSFSPVNRSYTTITSNQTSQDFTGTLAYTLAGQVTKLGGQPLAGATVTLTGASSGTKTTDANGNYSFTGLIPGGTYTVAPSMASYTFTPQNLTYGTISASRSDVNFEGVSTAPTDLQITMQASASEVQRGNNVTYTITVTNNGPNDAANIVIADNLPAQLTYQSCTASQGGTCVNGQVGGNNRTITFSSLATGATVNTQILASVNTNVPDQTQVTNTAQVSATNSDTNAGNNSASAQIKAVAPPPTADLSLAVSDSPDPVGIGQNLTYTLAVHNGGDGQATNVVVTATLPSGADFVSASVGCSRAGNTATCNVGQLAKGSNASVNIVVKPTAKGTLNFSAGVTSDVTDPDSSNNSAAATTEVSATGTQVKPGDIIISEFRSQGPGTPSAQSSSNAPEAFPGANDDFVELYNNTDAAVTVGPADASGGWALVVREPGNENAPVLLATIPTGTVIPARGHFLIASDAYTLGQIAQGDLVIPGNLLDGGGIALFRTADPSKFTSTADRLDAVGFSSVADTMYRESSGLAPIGQAQAQLSFVRKLNNETPQDTDDNAADFQLLTPDGAAIGGMQSVLGAPGPENLAAPPVRNGMLTPGLIAPNVAASSAPNRVRSTAPYSYTDPVTGQTTNFTLGTLSVRRTYTNNTGVNVTRLRFRIIDMTTGPAPAGVSDLRAISSTPQVVTVNSSNITLQGTVLDALPNQAEGGGINSTLSCCSTTGGTVIGERTVSLSQPLAPGQTIALQWLLGVKQIGSFRFYMNIEALP